MAKKIGFLLVIVAILVFSVPTAAVERQEFEAYQQRFSQVKTFEDIARQGFFIIEDQRYWVMHHTLGRIELIPSIDNQYNRTVLFFKDESAKIVFKTDNLESNHWIPDQMKQPNVNISTVAFRDVNGDGLEDLLLICVCVNDDGAYAGKPFNVGDVLFQDTQGFYRDWRVSDKMARFDMNKDIDAITAYVRDGRSMEFLYTAKTLEDLIRNGFQVIQSQSFAAKFEMFGVVQIVSGFYDLNGQSYLMLFVVNEAGEIVWNFQPMGDYVNFYNIKALSFIDMDGDGLEDITILANYVTYNTDGAVEIKADYNIYCQKAGFFIEETEIKNRFPCREDDNLNTITKNAKIFWGRGD